MKVRLLRKWNGWPIGRVIEIFDIKAKQMIRDNIAESYNGEYPPRDKMKTDFFKPKNKRK